ncbi:hypothetical protein MRB53_004213 [Persea americana]|nr:hypothetical protein MRB53_004213 [Persea americana]
MHKLEVLLLDMAPKEKRPCHRDSFDRARFLNEDGQNFFLNKYQHRSVVPERIVMYNELHDTDFCAHFPIVKNRQINYNLVAKELTGKPIAWVGGDTAHHKLTESYRLLNIFIRHNVNPKVSKRVTKEDGHLLYCIGTQRRVDLPLAVFRGMAKLHSASHNVALPFPGVISKLLVDMAGPSGVGPSGVGPSVVADSDEGNSGDDQIGEVAINALNDRIRRLEVRVNEGFTEMRQGFA